MHADRRAAMRLRPFFVFAEEGLYFDLHLATFCAFVSFFFAMTIGALSAAGTVTGASADGAGTVITGAGSGAGSTVRTVRAGVPNSGGPSMPFWVTIRTWSPAAVVDGTVIAALNVPAESGDTVASAGASTVSMRTRAGDVRMSAGSCGAKNLPATVTLVPATADGLLVLTVASAVQP